MTLVVEPPRTTGVDDAELIRRIGAGDRHALTLLYERHAPWLTVRLERRGGDPDQVDDAVQDTFLAVWRQARRGVVVEEVGAWLWTIAVRRLIDQFRRRRPPEPVGDLGPLAGVVRDEIPLALGDTDLGRAFTRLEPELQAVLVATALDGLDTRETATLLGIPRGTVKSRLHRARRRMKELLP